MTKEYKKIIKQIESLKKQATKLAKETIVAGLKEVFAKYPDLESVNWTQYTPSFNDGDPCVFQCNAAYAELDPSDIEGAEEDVTEFLEEFTDDDMEAMFGNGARVTVNRNGKIEIDDYYD